GGVDFFHDRGCGRHREPATAEFFGYERGKKAGFGQSGDEFFRIGALAIERPPIFAGKIGAQRADRFADRREIGAFRHGRTAARPLLTAITSRSTTRERKLTTSPSRHISVRKVSPGKTGAENRAANATSFFGSYAQKVFSTACAAVPKLPRPCMMGRGYPACLATAGS